MRICEDLSFSTVAAHRSVRGITNLSSALMAISIGTLSSCGFSSKPWVEVESHSTNWQGISSRQPPETTVSIMHTITVPVSPEGFFESKSFPENAFVITQSDANLGDSNSIHHVRDRIADKDKRGSVLLDSTKRKAIINLEEKSMNPNGAERTITCPENGTHEIRKWIVDGVPKWR